MNKASGASYALDGWTALVTGGGSGIGAATAALLAQRGALVVIADINGDSANEVAEHLRHTGLDLVEAAVMDVADPASVRQVTTNGPPFDILINNAAVCSDVDFLDLDPATFDRDLKVSLHGAFHCSQAVLPAMIRAGRGTIVNVASVNGLAYFGNEAYSAAKAGLLALTRSTAVQYGPNGIRCNAVAPGTIHTGLWEARIAAQPTVLEQVESFYPLRRIGKAEEVAEAITFLCAPASTWITGTCLVIDGGLTAGNAHLRDAIVVAGEA